MPHQRQCLQIGSLLDRQRAGLTEAECQRLERHLEECPACSEDARARGALGSLLDSQPDHVLSARARERALAAALVPERMSTLQPPPRERAMALFASGGLAAAAVVATIFLSLALARRDQAARPARQPAALPVAAELAGAQDRAAGHAAQLGALPTIDALARMHGSAPLPARAAETAHAQHDQAAGHGHPPALAPALAMPLGAVSAALGPSGVPQGVPYGSPALRALAEVFVAEAASPRPHDTVPGREPGQPGHTAASGARTMGQHQSHGAARLAQARQLLARGDPTAARDLLEHTRARALTRRQRAEAETLLAECALAQGLEHEAARRYEDVAERYPQLTAGENALFAAARLHDRAGRHDQAHALFGRYLDRYPAGHFRELVRHRLAAQRGPDARP